MPNEAGLNGLRLTRQLRRAISVAGCSLRAATACFAGSRPSRGYSGGPAGQREVFPLGDIGEKSKPATDLFFIYDRLVKLERTYVQRV